MAHEAPITSVSWSTRMVKVWASQGQSLKCRLRSLELEELDPPNLFLSFMQRGRVTPRVIQLKDLRVT